MAVNTKKYIEQFLQIRTKSAEVVPLRLNAPQQKLYAALAAQARAGKPLRAIVLKARQMGFSTLTEAMIFKRTATRKNVRSGIVAHDEDATNNLYRMTKLFYERLPEPMQPQRRALNARELVFNDAEGHGLNSSIRVMTAGGKGVGRSETFQNLHLSEVAFWPGDKLGTFTGLMQAVPDKPETMVIVESTANGFDFFKDLWDAAVAERNDFVPVFCAWWELPEYRRTCGDGFMLTPEEERLAALYGLDHEQLAWRRWAIENNCGGDVELFRQEYPACPEEAFLSTGSCIFDKAALMARLQALEPPMRRVRFEYAEHGGLLTLVGAVDDKAGPVLIYREPEPGKPYVLGGDTAGDGSDNFTGQVLDNTTGGQVAVLKQPFDEDEYARQMMCLGYFYNTALLGIEANFSTFPIKECTRLGYPRQYAREVTDSYTQRLERRYGFRTDPKSRPLAIAELVRYAREHPEELRDADTIREMLVFVKNERGRPEAMQGEHDDLVMGLAIAHAIRGQQSYLPEESGDGGAYAEEWSGDGGDADFLDWSG